ncbi:snaclec macrovipecetin subunit alpha [Strongylocentrotus purpuratus]|uniref:C-type lectin domain-containing protein n=1 Tax=Strongylocentrotus purpuratus TaxID=7668 RepID=A0A7M7G1M2_STRPU|nr:snaclec macrovipecetin subunit alpha [Strongylocentrotus purpuratus]|eukprot:XP_001200211.1 PREDICTED: snaclec 3-like isoform X1 [Strongylocentrotus purpuratus]
MSGLTCLILSSLLVAYASAQCPSPWEPNTLYPGFCYYHYVFPVSWDTANTICQIFAGGDLASIDEFEEGTVIYDYWNRTAIDQSLGYWIGLTDIHDSGLGTRQWTDWTSLQGKTNWQGGQRPTDTSEDCVYVANEGDTDEERKQWRATSCTLVLKTFICERKLVIN